MPLSIKHLKQSEKSDGLDDSLLQPTDWNANHVFKVDAESLVGNPTSSEANAQAVHFSDDFEFDDDGNLTLTTSLNDIDIVVATEDDANPEGSRVLTNTETITWDTATAEQVKANVPGDSITLGHMQHSPTGGEILFYNKTGSPIGAPGRLPVGDPGMVLTETGTNPAWKYSGAPHCVLIDQKPNGTGGGTFTKAGWRDRVINVQIFDTYHWVTFASNIFTLPIGAWVIEWSCPAQACAKHQTRLYNNTATAHPVVYGTSEIAPETGNHQTRSTGIAQVINTVATGYKIQHYCTEDGIFGVATDATSTPASVEVYTIVKIWRTGEA